MKCCALAFRPRFFSTAPQRLDCVIVGGGIAGGSAGYFLTKAGKRVAIVERENIPGYHSSGRSAALFRTHATAGPATVKLIGAARSFFLNPPAGFSEQPLLTPRGVILVGRDHQKNSVQKNYDALKPLVPETRLVDEKEALTMCPAFVPGKGLHGVTDPNAMDIDVHSLLQGYLRGFKAHGGKVYVNAECLSLERNKEDTMWTMTTKAGVFQAPVVINASGAWGDKVAQLAGVRPLGLVPKRRTVIVFEAPAPFTAQQMARWPFVLDADSQFYFKPDGQNIWACPMDQTPMQPCDVQPDELDIAICVDRMQAATTFVPKRILNKWSGLRSFVSDGHPVCGFDPHVKGFFWLVGQGGFGMQTSPSLGQITACLSMGKPIPQRLRDTGLTEDMLSPKRLAAKNSS
eukprot:TRINITY_DN751_c0_g1_i1.p1 TRINITY_DN751_c0_g1~~TRINITY_DN751_c0_g1_i1.p1  ORF type:complete len:403 (-),score=78.32 TRINITY_DN751_c0_g1_i1:302-1510(-)